MFENFDNLFDKMWNTFNRPVHDMYPFKTMKKENGWLILANTLGLSKEDIKVELEKKKGTAYPVLKIEGSTKLENLNFENSVSLGIKINIDESEIESIKYEVKNGLTSVFIKTKNPEEKAGIIPQCVDGSLDF